MRFLVVLLLIIPLTNTAQQVYIDFSKGEQLVVFRSENTIDSVWHSDGRSEFKLFATRQAFKSQNDDIWILEEANRLFRFPIYPDMVISTSLPGDNEATVVFVPKSSLSGTNRAPIDVLQLCERELAGSYEDITNGDVLSVAGSQTAGFTFQIKRKDALAFVSYKPLTFNRHQLVWVMKPKAEKQSGFMTFNYLQLTQVGRYFDVSYPDGTRQRFMYQ